jgi:hypothetical protein
MRLLKQLGLLLAVFSFVGVNAQNPVIFTQKTDAQCNGTASGSIRLYGSSNQTIDSASFDTTTFSAANVQHSGYQYINGQTNGATAIVLDEEENVYATYNYYDSIFIDSTWYFSTITGGSGVESFVLVKYNPLGEITYVKNAQTGNLPIYSYDLALDQFNNVYLSGGYFYSAQFNGVTLNQNVNNLMSAFVMKINDVGTTVWTRKIDGVTWSYARKLVVSNNQLGVAIDYRGPVTIEDGAGAPTSVTGGSYDAALICAFDLNGTLNWFKIGRNTNNSYPVLVADLAADQSNFYLLTRFDGQSYYENDTIGSATSLLNTGGVIAYSASNGNMLWANSLGCDGNGLNCSQSTPSAIKAFGNRVYATGSFLTTISYGALSFSTVGTMNTTGTYFLAMDQSGTGLWINGLKDANLNGFGGGSIKDIHQYQDSLILLSGGVAESVNMFGTIISNPYSYSDCFLATIDTMGALQGHTIWGTSASESVGNLSMNSNEAFAFTGSNADNQILSNPGLTNNLNGQSSFIAKSVPYFIDTTFQNLNAATYNLAIESGGVSASESVQILQSTSLNISKTLTDNLCFGETNGTINLSAGGGVAPYSYSWSGPNGFTANTANLSNLSAGIYYLTITDGQGCSSLDTSAILQPASAVSSLLTVTSPTCGFCNGEILASTVGGTAPYSFSWSGAGVSIAADSLLQNVCDSLYTLQVSDANNCMFTDSVLVVASLTCDSVWPGDINYDGTANNIDVIYWAMAFGDTGNTRANATLNWNGQPAMDWATGMGSYINAKHADCDGDGLVDAADVNAVSLNYGLLHPKGGSNRADVELKLNVDTAALIIANDSFVLNGEVLFQSTAAGSDSLFGLVYTLGLQSVSGELLHLDYLYDSFWFGNTSNTTDFVKQVDSNLFDVAMARTDRNTSFGNGRIGRFTISGALDNGEVPNFTIRTDNEARYAFNGDNLGLNSDAITYADLLGLENVEMEKEEMKVFPNPSIGSIQVEHSLFKNGSATVKLYSISGGLILDQRLSISNGMLVLHQSQIPLLSGTYLLTVETAGGVFNALITRAN